jgi:hypothetical protein
LLVIIRGSECKSDVIIILINDDSGPCVRKVFRRQDSSSKLLGIQCSGEGALEKRTNDIPPPPPPPHPHPGNKPHDTWGNECISQMLSSQNLLMSPIALEYSAIK